MDHEETMWAEMKPDVYGGKSGEQHNPAWEVESSGGMDGDIIDIISLDSSTFPPGTKVSVREPICPECDEIPTRSTDTKTFTSDECGEVTEYTWSCGCTFDWRNFANGEYS